MTEKQFNKKGQEVMKEATIFTQAQVAYVTLSPSPTEACANCVFYRSSGFDAIDWPHCHIVENWPEPIEPTGYCQEWREKPTPPPELAETIAEALTEAVVEITEAMPMMVEMSIDSKPKRKSFVDRLRELITPKPKDEAFSVFKGSDGQWHWHAIFTNNFEDREGEILTEKAHDNYIGRLDMGLVPMPVLMAWHTPGTEHGEADVIWRDAHLVHAVGHFDDTSVAQKAIKFYQKNVGKIKMSHGFTAPEWAFDGKHYDDYNTIEITTLPPYAAANPYTSFEELLTMQEKARSEEKSRYLADVVGKENLALIDAESGKVNKALEEMKVQYKDHSEVVPTPPTDATTPETTKALSELITDNITMLSEVIQLTKLQQKALEDSGAENKALKLEMDTRVSDLTKSLDELRQQVNLPPGRASESKRTVTTEKDGLSDKLPQVPDTFYGDLFAPTANGAKS